MDRQFFSGNTLEQAILAAARHHGLEPERVAYSLRDKKHGFVNIRRRVVIEVDPEAPERSEDAVAAAEVDATPEAPAEKSPRPSPASDEGSDGPWWVADPVAERSEGDGSDHLDPDAEPGDAGWRGEETTWTGDAPGDESVIDALKHAVEKINQLLAISAVPSVRKDEDEYEIDLAGPDTEALRQHRGSGLSAIEHLLPRMVRGLNGRGIPCRVDSEGFRAAYERELERMALDTADLVSDELEEKRLEPMNPADRRIVHMALADHPEVITESEGQGFMKRVRIIPA